MQLDTRSSALSPAPRPIASAGLKRARRLRRYSQKTSVNELPTDLPAPFLRAELVDAVTIELAPREVVPVAHIARIHTWVKYDMTIS